MMTIRLITNEVIPSKAEVVCVGKWQYVRNRLSVELSPCTDASSARRGSITELTWRRCTINIASPTVWQLQLTRRLLLSFSAFPRYDRQRENSFLKLDIINMKHLTVVNKSNMTIKCTVKELLINAPKPALHSTLAYWRWWRWGSQNWLWLSAQF